MKTTGVKDVPKKILLVFLGHPNVNIIKLKECLFPILKQPGAGPGCCDRRRLVAGCRPGSRYPPHLAFTLVKSSHFLSRDFAESQAIS